MKGKRTILTVLLSLPVLTLAGRELTSLDGQWWIKPISHNQQNQKYEPVTVPHTWNAEYPEGSTEYRRETMVYRRDISVAASDGQRRFLYFEGVNSVCDVFVNRHYAGSHKGGYTAFCLEVTELLRDGENNIELWVSNAWRSDVAPLIGDFNIFGGIHRSVHLLTTGRECISPLFHASSGVFIDQKAISGERADIEVRTLVDAASLDGLSVRVTVSDPSGRTVCTSTAEASATTAMPFSIDSPALWNGRGAASLYTVSSELLKDGTPVDRVDVTTGFRSLAADCEKGILLNGKPYPVHGFCRHEDFAGRGSALRDEDRRLDMKLIDESGATGLRLAHYPHPELIYSLADSLGILVWTETPMCGPGGFQFTGYMDTPEFRDNVRQALRELVYQKYNHPSVCFWGIFNEIVYDDGARFLDYGDPAPFVAELGAMFKELDPSRLTTFATCEDETHYLGSADLVAWNKYFGWYQRDMNKAGEFFDSVRANCRPYPLGISEYGAGASIEHHAWPIDPTVKVSAKFHPEEKQAQAHEDNWALIRERPWLWGTFIWNFADFHSSIRDEGDTPGINDKGLVTNDRKTCKDAYYFYKAEWTTEPMIYICSRRFKLRNEPEVEVRAYSNQESAVLYVNGVKVGKAVNDGMSRLIWENVRLSEGDNTIEVVSGKCRKSISDSCVWTYVKQ